MNLNEKIYYRGTIIEATYEWETGVETHQSILAESSDEGFAFQVIQLDGHDAGEIESMIQLQFEEVCAVFRSCRMNCPSNDIEEYPI